MKKFLILALLIGCGGDSGNINKTHTDHMEKSIPKELRFMQLPQFNNVCVAYAWMGNEYGGPIAFVVPCEMNGVIKNPCGVSVGGMVEK